MSRQYGDLTGVFSDLVPHMVDAESSFSRDSLGMKVNHLALRWETNDSGHDSRTQ